MSNFSYACVVSSRNASSKQIGAQIAYACMIVIDIVIVKLVVLLWYDTLYIEPTIMQLSMKKKKKKNFAHLF